MPNWMPSRPPRLTQRRVNRLTPIGELRQHYDTIAEGFGVAPPDISVEPAQLGQIRGEWVCPAGGKPHRMLLYLHGGGYIAGSPESHRPLVARLCQAADAAAFSLNYRLGPEFPFPAGLRDAVDCYRALLAKGIAPESIAIAGDGSGGGLAFSTLMAIRNAALPMPAACVAMSPWADLTLSGWSMMQHQESDNVLTWDLLFVCARHYLNGGNPGDPYASPALGSLRDFPPIMVHAGSLELLRDDAARLGELAAQAGVPVSVEVYDGQPHLFQGGSGADAKVSLGRLGHFIRARTPERQAVLEIGKAPKAVKSRV
jgi:epsilon-lactone hydrolase